MPSARFLYFSLKLKNLMAHFSPIFKFKIALKLSCDLLLKISTLDFMSLLLCLLVYSTKCAHAKNGIKKRNIIFLV